MKILAQNFPGYYFPNSTLSGTIRRTKSFVASDDTAYVAGNADANQWLQPFTPSIEDNELMMPGIVLAPTVDSDDPGAKYIVEIVSKKTGEIPFLVKEFRLPVTPDGEITWNEIRTNQRACIVPYFREETLTSEQIYATFLRASKLQEILGAIVSGIDGGGADTDYTLPAIDGGGA